MTNDNPLSNPCLIGDLFSEAFEAESHSLDLSTLPLEAWGRRFFPHYFTLPSSKQHQWLAHTLVEASTHRGLKIVIQGPRDSAKSTWMSFLYPLYCVCNATEKYIILVADTHEQAVKYLENITAELTGNADLIDAYPQATGEGAIWNKKQVLTRNDIMIETLGTSKRMRGRKNKEHRPSLIIVDDPEDNDAGHSQNKRDKNWEWMQKVVMKAGSAITNVLVAGTLVHRDCLVGRLAHLPTWVKKTFQSLISYPDNMHLWEEWKEVLFAHDITSMNLLDPSSGSELNAKDAAKHFYEAHESEMIKGAEVLWPEKEPLYDLMLLWAEDKVSFESEKQNRPIDPSTIEWGDEYFDYEGFWFEEWLPRSEYTVSVLGLDPSKGRDSRKSDYSAYILLKRDKHGWLWVQADMKRRPTEMIVDDGLAIVREHPGIDALICESTMFQHLFEEIFFSHGQAQNTDVPFIGRDTNIPKIVRIRTIGPYLRRHKVRFHRDPMTQLLVEQLRDFPNGTHDDGPDALEMALSGAIEIFNGSYTPDPTLGRRIAM